MTYRQLTPGERYMLAALRRQGLNQSQIARGLGRHRGTICRELCRNSTRAGGRYRASTAQERTNGRRSRSRRNRRFSTEDFALVDELLCRQLSPERAAGYLRRAGLLSISHEAIYHHVWWDKEGGGTPHAHLRGARGAGSATARTTAAAGSQASARSRSGRRRRRPAARSGTGRPIP